MDQKKNSLEKGSGYTTQSVHGGEYEFNDKYAITTPIYQTATYTFENTAQLCDFFEGRSNRISEYGRYGNPTQEVAEHKLRELENAESALLFPSGMNAVTTAIFAICKQGDHVIVTSDSYRRTRQFIRQVMSRFGVEFSLCEPDAMSIEKTIQKNTRLIISESPTNPYLRVPDIEKIVEIAQRNHIKTLIDSTLATPYNFRPLDYGVDIVIHSVTKYLAGHNDVLAGVLLGKSSIISAIKELQAIIGGISDPNSSYLIIRGLKTFPLRMERQNHTALAVASFLESHPKIEKVWYPGLKSHPDYAHAQKYMNGFGGVVSFQIKGNLQTGSLLVDSMKIPKIAPSIGGVESLIEQPSLMSYYELTTEEREKVGIYDNLIRFSIGIEDTDDIVKDLKQALDKI
ncbi:MAG: aminotransferase class I/II-fold pyridoxal phosphate-dependent enzyme [Spirochaetia bacterium]|nr:aminotransferase class I/II-fold pyridoxal phosphate-dependent enzyme [Spirochaetia bacterium]